MYHGLWTNRPNQLEIGQHMKISLYISTMNLHKVSDLS